MNRAYYGNLFAVVLFFAYISASIFFSVFPVEDRFLMNYSQFITLLLPTVLFLNIMKRPLHKVIPIRFLDLYNILLLILFSFLIQPLASLLSAVTELFFPNSISDTVLSLAHMPLSYLLLTLAFIPAVCEELAFRGVILTFYQNISYKKAILVNGLLFALMHFNLQQFLYAFVLGMFFAYFVQTTGSIYASVLCHFLINGSQVCLAKIISDTSPGLLVYEPTFESRLSELATWTQVTVFTLPLLWLVIYLFHRHNTKNKSHPPQFPDRVLDLPFCWVLLSYLLFVLIFPFLSSLSG